MKITYLGHSALLLELENKQKLLFDPFISGNPLLDLDPSVIETDWILLTHGHSDHIGDTYEIAKQNDATVISIVEIANFFGDRGLKTHGMNIGGSFEFPFGRVKLVPALHSSSYEFEGKVYYMGEPTGIILEVDGKTIYHAGDTAEFSDMDLIGTNHDIDLAFLPIGDNFTMGPAEAARAARRIQAKKVVPIHYNTFPLIEQDGKQFAQQLPDVGMVMEIGESIEI